MLPRAIHPERSPQSIRETGRCWCTPDGTGTGARPPTALAGIPFSPARRLSIWRAAERVLVGIDSLNIDDATDGTRPAHTTLLGAGIPIVEHLTGLERLPDAGFRFFAVPPEVRGMGSFPVRAFAAVHPA